MSFNNYQSISTLPAVRQRGFVLVLALVMLAVLTLIGVSSMNSATIELKTTANSRQHQVAYNAAQSLLEYTASDGGVGVIDYQTKTPNSIASYTGIAGASAVSATVTYLGCSVAIGSSLEDGKSFNYSYYNVAGSASNSTATATSLQSQGVRYPAAGC